MTAAIMKKCRDAKGYTLTMSTTSGEHELALVLQDTGERLRELGHKIKWEPFSATLFHGICRQCGRAVAAGISRGVPVAKGQLLEERCNYKIGFD